MEGRLRKGSENQSADVEDTSVTKRYNPMHWDKAM
jgi:hypothetical protein